MTDLIEYILVIPVILFVCFPIDGIPIGLYWFFFLIKTVDKLSGGDGEGNTPDPTTAIRLLILILTVLVVFITLAVHITLMII